MFGTRVHRRYILPSEAAAFASGRFGRRRARTSECWAVFRAEDCYTSLISTSPVTLRPGHRATLTWKVRERQLEADCELRSNAVWRHGRLFFGCPKCGRRCTRLYVPTKTSGLGCRRCWGLTYISRALLNYKDSPWGRGAFARIFVTSQRDWAYQTTDECRQKRMEASRARWKARASFLRST